jgi:hypothetical protein
MTGGIRSLPAGLQAPAGTTDTSSLLSRSASCLALVTA